MKIAITGSEGQLGRELAILLGDRHSLFPWPRQKLDICDFEQCKEAFESVKPGVVIHCAAYTNVDACEYDRERAYRVNALGTGHVAMAAERIGAKLIYISTDYVFDGTKGEPYVESDRPNPLNVYGQSKLAGEVLVSAVCERSFIVRTSWLYGGYGKNFVSTMLDFAAKKKTVLVVNDQIGSPTYTKETARFLAELLATEMYGLYHCANEGHCSWFAFAREIFRSAGYDPEAVLPIPTSRRNDPAKRPAFSALKNAKLERGGFSRRKHWREALAEFLWTLGKERVR